MLNMNTTTPNPVLMFPTGESDRPSRRVWRIAQLVQSGELPVSETTLRRMIAEGKIRVKRVGSGRGCFLIPDSEVRRLFGPEDDL